MVFELDSGGRTRTVSVERLEAQGSRFRVSIDGRSQEVEAVKVDRSTFSLLFADGRSERVGVAPEGRRGELRVHVRGGSISVAVDGRRWRRSATERGAIAGEERVVAPMPGRVVRVFVTAGDRVEPRQPLVVVEAMKMENEFRAARGGRVKEVGARVGMSVEAGRLLVVIE